MGDAGDGVLGHSGRGPGASTAVYWRDDGRGPVTVAVLTNGEDGGAERLALAVLERLTNRLP